VSGSKEKKLWFIRHGQTVWNEKGLISGWTDVPLTPEGEAQATALRPRLQKESFTSVWASDLQRARTTAELAHGEHQIDPRLRELYFGTWEGVSWEGLEDRLKEKLLQFEGFCAPEGEHVDTLRRRVLSFIDELPQGTHLLFVHAALIRMVLREVGADKYLPPTSVVAINWTRQTLEFIEEGPEGSG
tara:strand:- start:848 stop:1408 length:561 start_codon:yes stop_codon:yes gene_type:complete